MVPIKTPTNCATKVIPKHFKLYCIAQINAATNPTPFGVQVIAPKFK